MSDLCTRCTRPLDDGNHGAGVCAPAPEFDLIREMFGKASGKAAESEPPPRLDLSGIIPRPGAFPCVDRCGATLEYPGVCDACAGAEASREQALRLRPALESIPPQFQWSWLGAPELAVRCPRSAGIAPEAWAKLLRYRVVMLVGASGEGKTSLGCALLRAVIDAGRHPAGVAEHERAKRARFFACRTVVEPPAEGPPWKAQTRAASVALFDDVGQESSSAGFRASDRAATLAEMLFDRHDVGGLTIITTCHREEAWLRMYGDGARRRFWAKEDPRIRIVDLDAGRKAAA